MTGLDSGYLPQIMWLVFAAIWGACLGSFTTCVIYRIPRRISIWREQQEGSYRSFCPVCQAPLRALDLVPILSWLALGGRCRYCRTSIPVRYVLIEVAILSLVMAMAFFLGLGVWFFIATLLIPALSGVAVFFAGKPKN